MRRRNLCNLCYYQPEIRSRYPTTSRFAPKATDFNGGYRRPRRGVKALPGSPQKVEVLVRRAEQKLSLWHPTLDARENLE